jgi:hypothetical protein
MNRNVIPAEYDLPEDVNGPHKRQWWAALAAVAIILGATLALVASNQTESPVVVTISR